MSTFAGGSRIGGYEILAPLRSGGMAAFYLARRVGPAGFVRPIGIKVVHAHLAEDRAFIDMFLDEARLSARIVHPNVVHVEELGESEGSYFLAMELVHGGSLSSILARARDRGCALTVPVACAIAMRVADGLHAAHEARDESGALLEVVHRDVSPQNVLLGADGRVKLIDFGVAKARGRLSATEGGSLKGKLRYMSPEQAWGRPIDRRTDVYALGIVLWESLTGRRLFGGASEVETLERVRAPRIPDASSFEPSVPPALDEVLRTALAADPDQRFDTAQALRRAIGNACPAALEVEPDEIGALVRTLMASELEHERTLLTSFAGAVPPPRADDATVANDAMHATQQISIDEPAAEIAAPVTPSAPSATPVVLTPPGRGPSRAALLAIALGLALVPAIAWLAWPRAPLGPCDRVTEVDPAGGAPTRVAFDTREGTMAFALAELRNPAAPAVPSAVLSYVVPGHGERTVAIDTAVEGTSERFDTVVAIYRGRCEPSMAHRAADFALDDEGDHAEYRASGAVRATGGEPLTIVVSGYGGAVGGREDVGAGVVLLGTRDPGPPTLTRATVALVGTEIQVDVEGSDPDGDLREARLRFAGRDGSPIALVPLDVARVGAFSAHATLDVGEIGAANMRTATSVEVALVDRAENASLPLEVTLPAAIPDASLPAEPPPAP